MNKIKLMVNRIKTMFGNMITGYHRGYVYTSLESIEQAKIDGDDESRKYWEKVYIKHGLKVPEFKEEIQDWLNRNK